MIYFKINNKLFDWSLLIKSLFYSQQLLLDWTSLTQNIHFDSYQLILGNLTCIIPFSYYKSLNLCSDIQIFNKTNDHLSESILVYTVSNKFLQNHKLNNSQLNNRCRLKRALNEFILISIKASIAKSLFTINRKESELLSWSSLSLIISFFTDDFWKITK